MASINQRSSMQQSAQKVNLHCSCCHSQIGIFDNEWIRLTSTYARARTEGICFGTETGERIKVVPYGQAQKALEGCGMSEVFCKDCSSLIGQYCRNAPDDEKEVLVGHHIYKTSRTYLKDARNGDDVEPHHDPSGEYSLPPPPSRASESRQVRRKSAVPRSQTPVIATPLSRDLRGSSQFRRPELPPHIKDDASWTSGDKNETLARLLSLERHVSNQRVTISEVAILRTSVVNLEKQIQRLREEVESLRENDRPTTPAPPMDQYYRGTPVENDTDVVREENRQLKAKLATIASAIGLAPEGSTDNDRQRHSSTTISRMAGSLLGKRKRIEVDENTSALSDQAPSESKRAFSGNPAASMPTPHSMHDLSEEQDVSVNSDFFPRSRSGTDNIVDAVSTTNDEVLQKRPLELTAIPQPVMSQPVLPPNAALPREEEADKVVEFSDDEMTETVVRHHQSIQQLQAKSSESRRTSMNPNDQDKEPDFSPNASRSSTGGQNVRKGPAKPRKRIESTEESLDIDFDENELSKWVPISQTAEQPEERVEATHAITESARKESAAHKSLTQSALPSDEKEPTPVEEDGRRSRRSTRHKEPLTETMAQPKSKPVPAKTTRKRNSTKKAITPEVRDSEEGEENQENRDDQGKGHVSKEQPQETEFEKRDRMAQEVMEMEEAISVEA